MRTLEVEPTGQRGSTTSRRGRNVNEAVAAPEAFVRWLHHQYVPIEPPSEGHII